MVDERQTRDIQANDTQTILFSMIRELKSDVRDNFKSLNNAVLEVHADIGRLMRDHVSVKSRVDILERSHERMDACVDAIKSVQDGCLARLQFEETTGRVRTLEGKRTTRTPPSGGISIKIPAKAMGPAGKALALALASLLGVVGTLATDWLSKMDPVQGSSSDEQSARRRAIPQTHVGHDRSRAVDTPDAVTLDDPLPREQISTERDDDR